MIFRMTLLFPHVEVVLKDSRDEKPLLLLEKVCVLLHVSSVILISSLLVELKLGTSLISLIWTGIQSGLYLVK